MKPQEGQKEQKRSHYLQTLCFIFFNRIVSKRDLGLLSEYSGQMTKTINDAIMNGHIRQVELKIKDRTSAHPLSIQAFVITKDGIRFLIDKYHSSWFQTISYEELDNILLFSKFEYSMYQRLKLTSQSTAILMSKRAGAIIPIENFTTEYEDNIDEDRETENRLHFSTFLSRTLTEYEYNELQMCGPMKGINVNSDIVFHSATLVKQNAGNANKLVSVTEFNKGRYRGVLDSECRSILLYVAQQSDMQWSRWFTRMEVTAHSQWVKSAAMLSQSQSEKTGLCAGIIVKNQASFEKAYKLADVEHEKNEQSLYGGTFDHFYVFPEDENGIKQMNWLMQNDDADINDAIISFFSKQDGFHASPNSKLFPLVNAYNHKTAVCLTFDAKQLLSIQRVALAKSDEAYAIICFPWQKEYYQRVLPENVYYIETEFDH